MTYPEALFDFAFFGGRFDQHIQNLSEMAEEEDWKYKFVECEKDNPILVNYINYTYKRIAEESKICVSEDEAFACFDTGLINRSQEPIYAVFRRNKVPDQQPWFFLQWARKGDVSLNKFSELPDMAHYFDDPRDLVFDIRIPIRENAEHIIADNTERFPEPFKGMDQFLLLNIFKGALESAKTRVRRNYKIAIPQYYRGRMQLLLPICLSNPKRADLALTIERHEGFYRASTILTLDMAYNNARQIARPDKDWLQP